MKQVVQPANGGPVRVIEVPRPVVGATEVLVQTVASAVSPGTERAVTKLAQSSLLAKARARPDLVRQVMKKASTEGISKTAPLATLHNQDQVRVKDVRPGDTVVMRKAGTSSPRWWRRCCRCGHRGAVSAHLDDDMPLGYSAAGIALEVGEAVAGISPGQIVATGGAGKANTNRTILIQPRAGASPFEVPVGREPTWCCHRGRG